MRRQTLPAWLWLAERGVREAIELCARLEGVLFDPVYTGKAMAGLMRWIREGKISANDVPLFIHTGGLPGLFACEDYLANCKDFRTAVLVWLAERIIKGEDPADPVDGDRRRVHGCLAAGAFRAFHPIRLFPGTARNARRNS